MSRVFDIYYTKPEHFRAFIFGDVLPTISELEKTHVLLMGYVRAESMDHIFSRMQAENWSPHGEARDLIRNKGLAHTSMSVGDVVRDCDGGEFFVCGNTGWKKLEN